MIIQDGKVKRWERGVNRIADLMILPELEEDSFEDAQELISNSPSMASMTGSNLHRRRSGSPEKIQIRHVQIEDEWGHFKVKFSVYDPHDDMPGAGREYMSMIG